MNQKQEITYAEVRERIWALYAQKVVNEYTHPGDEDKLQGELASNLKLAVKATAHFVRECHGLIAATWPIEEASAPDDPEKEPASEPAESIH